MVRDTAFECKSGYLPTPFYRMHLHPRRHSQQHQLLLDLEAKGELVFYAAPHFHKPEELNDAYLKGCVIDRSIFIKPGEIGPLSDDDIHHVAFRAGMGAYFCSEPRQLRGEEAFRFPFDHEVRAGLQQRRRFDGSTESVRRLANELMECVIERIPQEELSSEQRENLVGCDPRLQVAYLTRHFFSCELILVAARDNDVG